MIKKLDFIWSSQKEYFTLKPLYEEAQNQNWDAKIKQIHRSSIRNYFKHSKFSDYIVISHDTPLKRIKKLGWNGKYIYVEHGLSPMKNYTYKYSFFHKADLLFYPGNVFKRKMDSINPNFKNGLIAGYPRMDELYKIKINKIDLCKKFKLDQSLPIILFAPSWGGKYSNDSGINNIKYFNNINNLITIPHPADYKIAKKYNCIIPKKDENINQFIHLSDIIISDVSSVLVEACLLDKPVIQLLLKNYPGCFPEKDKRKEKPWITEELIKTECNIIKNSKHPFILPYIHEEWLMGHLSKPESIKNTIKTVLKEKNRYKKNRAYWAKECCHKFDGKISERMIKMMEQYINSNTIEKR
tara:strand:- start:761 stop:1825 length:1065 start_codon:yes stop_codon:yes gene_type:complete